MSGEAYLGAHTLVILTADGTRWPVERGSIEPRFDPWTPDAVQLATRRSRARARRDRECELKLLAAFAQCYHGRGRFEELPKVPVELADRIARAGGLVE